jgi:hypothetical protein
MVIRLHNIQSVFAVGQEKKDRMLSISTIGAVFAGTLARPGWAIGGSFGSD